MSGNNKDKSKPVSRFNLPQNRTVDLTPPEPKQPTPTQRVFSTLETELHESLDDKLTRKELDLATLYVEKTPSIKRSIRVPVDVDEYVMQHFSGYGELSKFYDLAARRLIRDIKREDQRALREMERDHDEDANEEENQSQRRID